MPTDARAHLAALASYVEEQETTLKAMQGENARLKAENARLKEAQTPPPQPTPTRTRILWGTSGDPSDVEKIAGRPVPIHRVFEPSSEIASLERKIRASNKAGHTEVYASIKPPTDWISVPEAWGNDLASMAARLKADGIKTMVAVNHEPEGGNGMGNRPDHPSGPKGFQAMYKRLVTSFSRQTVSDMLTMVLMGYDWAPGSGRNPSDWWVDGVAEIGVDRYVRGVQHDPWTARNFQDILAFAKAKKKRIVLAEYGHMGLTTEELRQQSAAKLVKFAEQLEADGTVRAVCYFHTTKNGGEPLTGAMLTTYAALVKASPR